ncbi:hypothetical protein [Micromonospora haikouensis]|uniref:hypothetical protein n=1 Tax=Micromonospora haikouensis TaxID=686309 RepID=UPI00379FC195
MAAEEEHDRWRNLARDVGVNVIANLIAGAIGYLLAVTFGYVRGNRWLIATLITYLGFAGIMLVAWVSPRWGHWHFVGLILIVLMFAGTLLAGLAVTGKIR